MPVTRRLNTLWLRDDWTQTTEKHLWRQHEHGRHAIIQQLHKLKPLHESHFIRAYLRVHGSASNRALFGGVVNQSLNLMHLVHLCAHMQIRTCYHTTRGMIDLNLCKFAVLRVTYNQLCSVARAWRKQFRVFSHAPGNIWGWTRRSPLHGSSSRRNQRATFSKWMQRMDQTKGSNGSGTSINKWLTDM